MYKKDTFLHIKSIMKELQGYIGKIGKVRLHELVIDVRILDVKSAYGNERFLCTPIAGNNESWFDRDKVINIEL